MPEGIPENLPPKKPGIVKRLVWAVRESLPWDPVGEKKRSIAPFPEGIVLSKPRVRIVPDERGNKPNTLPTLEQNIKASERFIKEIRDPRHYEKDPYDTSLMKSDLGFLIEGTVEKGWFRIGNFVRAATDRYQLPLAIYIADNHARLVVASSKTSDGLKLKVYNPMLKNFQEVQTTLDATRNPIGVFVNLLAQSSVYSGEYNITKSFESPELARYKELLTEAKAFNFQNDAYNCIPYCLFVNAMLYGLEPGNTDFKTHGIKQFEQDFGVRIMTREEIVPPKTRVRIIG